MEELHKSFIIKNTYYFRFIKLADSTNNSHSILVKCIEINNNNNNINCYLKKFSIIKKKHNSINNIEDKFIYLINCFQNERELNIIKKENLLFINVNKLDLENNKNKSELLFTMKEEEIKNLGEIKIELIYYIIKYKQYFDSIYNELNSLKESFQIMEHENKSNKLLIEKLQLKLNKLEKSQSISNYTAINNNKHLMKNYFFNKNPNLKFKENITSIKNIKDKFDIYNSIKDNQNYLALQNQNTNNIEIYNINKQYKLIKSLGAHRNKITFIQYFCNINVNEEFLISVDSVSILVIWNILKDYSFINFIDLKYNNNIVYSCLLLFNVNKDEENYIITSCFNSKLNNEKNDFTKIFSFNKGNHIKNINNTKTNNTKCLIEWFNSSNEEIYIIECCNKKISINNLFKDETYTEFLDNECYDEYYDGYLHNNNFLITSSFSGVVNIWDLLKKNCTGIIYTNGVRLNNIVCWNHNYCIVPNFHENTFYIIDIEQMKVITTITNFNKNGLYILKKIIHPTYGDSLLTVDNSGNVNLFSV